MQDRSLEERPESIRRPEAKPRGISGTDAGPTTSWGSMVTIDRLLLILGALVLAEVAPTYAQAPRHGFWIDLGLGYGSASFSCDTCTGSRRLGGWTGSGGLGGTFSPHVRLGADLRLWWNGLKAGGRLPGIDNGTLSLSYYPRTRGGPFVKGGAGFSHYEVCKGTGDPIEPCSRDPSYYSGTGWGVTLGAGWEIPIPRGALRPLLEYHHGAASRLHSPNGATVATGWRQRLLSVEIRVLAGT